MFNRPRSHPKTGWSLIANMLSDLNLSQMLVGYLYLFSQVVKAEDSVTRSFYLDGTKINSEPQSVCIEATPGCLLTVKPHSYAGKVESFAVQQTCGESSFMNLQGRASLGNQIKDATFFGQKLCAKKLTNNITYEPVNTQFRYNTDYTVDLSLDDRVKVTYQKRF